MFSLKINRNSSHKIPIGFHERENIKDAIVAINLNVVVE